MYVMEVRASYVYQKSNALKLDCEVTVCDILIFISLSLDYIDFLITKLDNIKTYAECVKTAFYQGHYDISWSNQIVEEIEHNEMYARLIEQSIIMIYHM